MKVPMKSQVIAVLERGGSTMGGWAKSTSRKLGCIWPMPRTSTWTLWDGRLFVPEKWFSADAAQRRAKAGIPNERYFQTKVELGWQMIERAIASGLSVEGVAFDSLYGRNHWLRQRCAQAELEYYADIPNNYPLYRQAPVLEFQL